MDGGGRMREVRFKETEIGKIPEDWEIKCIGDVFELSQGLQIAKEIRIPYPKEGYIPLLKITDLPDQKFSEFVTNIRENYIAHKDDIIYTRTGQVGLVYTDVEGCAHNNCFKVHFDKEKFDKYFVYYLLKTKRIYEYSNSVASGSVQKDLTHSAFKSCIIAFPHKIEEQKVIAKILFDLDSKISLNHSTNTTLEAIGQALFKHWFIDFEFPDWEGKPYRSSGGEMVETELGEVPKGWRVGTLGDIADNNRRGVQPDEIEPHIPYIGLEHMPRKNIALGDWDYAKNINSNKFQFHKGNILFGKLRPYFHKVGIAAVDGVCSTDILVIVPKKPIWYGSVLFHISSVELVDHADATSTGTRMPRTNWDDIASFQIMLPPNDIAQKFSENILPLIQEIQENILQSRILAEIRDALLPKLMSGEIRVNTIKHISISNVV